VTPDDVSLIQLILGSVGGYVAAYALAKKLFDDSDDFPTWALAVTVPITPVGVVPAVLTSIFIGEFLLGIPYGEGGVLKAFIGPFVWVLGVALVARQLEPKYTPIGPAAETDPTAPPHGAFGPSPQPAEDQPARPIGPPTPSTTTTGHTVATAARCVEDSTTAMQELRTTYQVGSTISGIGTGILLVRLRDAAEEVLKESHMAGSVEISSWAQKLGNLLAKRADLAWDLIAAATYSRQSEYQSTLSGLTDLDSQIASLSARAPRDAFTP
jgi:hypothetical protein